MHVDPSSQSTYSPIRQPKHPSIPSIRITIIPPNHPPSDIDIKMHTSCQFFSVIHPSSICQSIYLSVRPSVCPPVRSSTHPSILHQPIHLSVRPSNHSSTHSSICPSFLPYGHPSFQPASHSFIHEPIHPFIHPSRSIQPSIFQPKK